MNVNEKKWEENLRVLKMNQDVLHFNISFVSKENCVSCNIDAREPLRSQVSVLVKEIVENAMSYAGQIPLGDIDPADQEDYLLRWVSMFQRNESFLMQVLIDKGIDAYKDALYKEQLRLHAAYLLEHTKPELSSGGDISYYGPAGFSFDGSAWTKSTSLGTEYRVDTGLNWQELLA